ncbi:MAG: hypothetical protein MZU97_05230 [Bacillus subtilis]|nr:hypothetical protein [Bacillus subtilis]
MIAFGVAFSMFAGVLLFIASFFILDIYQVSEAAKTIARFSHSRQFRVHRGLCV